MNKRLKKIIEKNQYRSPFYQQYKKRKQKKLDKKTYESLNKYLYSFLNKVLISLIILFVLLISKKSDKVSFIYDKTLKNMNFMQIKVFIDHNLNGLFPKIKDKEKYVDAVVINTDNSKYYLNGVIIETEYLEPVYSAVDGIVIRIYKDKELGQVLVIQDRNGYEYHYGFLDTIEASIYQSVNYGEILGIGRINDNLNCEYYLAIKDGKYHLDVIEVVSKDEN